MTALYRIVYASKNLIDAPEAEMLATVEQILAASQRNNQRCGVTGALLFNRGAFAQVLEGPQGGVEATFERIQRDIRHADVTVLQCGPAEARAFETWSMAFVGQSSHGQALWSDLAGRSGFDLSRLDGDEVFTMLHGLVLDEETIPNVGPATRDVAPEPTPASAFDPEQVRAEIERLRPPHARGGSGAAPIPPKAISSKPAIASLPKELASSPDDVETPVLRAALLAERQRTTALRAELDEARIAAAKSSRDAGDMRAQRDLWAERSRLLASLIGAEAAELTRLAILKDEAA